MDGLFHIRDLTKGDVDRYIEILRQSFVEEFEVLGFNEEGIRKQTRFLPVVKWIQKISGNVDFMFYVGEVDDRVVATLLMDKSGRIWHIGAIMTAPEHRRKGYAESLLRKACEAAREYGGERIILHVRKDNVPAKNLYKKVGFREFMETIYFCRAIEVAQRELPMPNGYTLARTGVFSSKALKTLMACRDSETSEVYGETTPPPFYVRVWLRLFKPVKMKRFAIKKDNEWIGLYTLLFKSENEATEAYIRLLQPHRGKGMEEALLTKALNRTHELGATRVVITFNRRNRELESACGKLGFTETIAMTGMYREL